MNNTQENASTLHACLLDVANEIKRICDKNELKYFLIGGTLLGCVRHGGIIPWDDDLDIGMLREDYERFLAVCEKELSEPYILCTADKEKNYGLMFAKIRINNTALHENDAPSDIHSGIFVDIFPIDKFPSSKTKQKRHAKKLYRLRKILLAKCHYRLSYGNSLKKLICQLWAFSCSKKRIVNALKKHQTKFNAQASDFYTNFNSPYSYNKELYPSKCLDGTLAERPFDSCSFKTPHFPEEILTLMYGDYMTPPPPEKRVFRHAGNVDFGNYTPHSLNK